jgi:hypothetical protein
LDYEIFPQQIKLNRQLQAIAPRLISFPTPQLTHQYPALFSHFVEIARNQSSSGSVKSSKLFLRTAITPFRHSLPISAESALRSTQRKSASAWYEQKAVIVLLALLVKNFGISGIGTVEEDMKKFF